MPVSGNEEPRGFSGQTQMQELPWPFKDSSTIPIKKRRFPIIQSPPPPPEEKPPCSEENKRESEIPDHGLPLVASGDVNSPNQSDSGKTSCSKAIDSKLEEIPSQSDLSKNSSSIIFESKPESDPPKVEVSASMPVEDPMVVSGRKVDISSPQESLVTEVPRSSAGVQLMMVKEENVSEQSEKRCKLDLSSSSKNIELSLDPKGPVLDSFQPQNTEAISDKPEEKLNLQEKDSIISSVSSQVCANRSSWDLNTTMDEWEGFPSNESSVNKSADAGGSSKIHNSPDLKSSWAMSSVTGLSLNKEINMNKGSSYSSDSALCSSRQNKSVVSLGLSLSMPGRVLDPMSSLSEKSVTSPVGPNVYLQQVNMKTKSVNFASPKAVKSEPVDESSRHSLGIVSSNVGLSKISSVKKEIFQKRHQETLSLSPLNTCNLDYGRLTKSESDGNNKEICRFNDPIPPRTDGRIMQHQESSASSSSVLMVPTPQTVRPPRLLYSSELTISEELSNQSQHSVHSEDMIDRKDIPAESIVAEIGSDKSSSPCEVGNSNVENSEKRKLAGAVENPPAIRQNSVDMDISEDMVEEDSIKSDCESHQKRAAVARGKSCKTEDGEYEEGEIRESLRRSAEENRTGDCEKLGNVKIESVAEKSQSVVLSVDPSISGSDLDRKSTISDNLDETHNEHIKECVAVGYEHCVEGSSSQKSADRVLDAEVDFKRKRSVSVSSEKKLDVPGQKDVTEGGGEEESIDKPIDGNHGIGTGQEDCENDEAVKGVFSAKQDSTSHPIEASMNDDDAAKDSNNYGNKSRIINLSRASAITIPSKTKYVPNRLSSRNGKERYSDLDGEIRPRWKRDEIYNDGLNKFGKDKIHDPSFRNPRPSFMVGKGRISGRFGPLRNEWDSNQEFFSESYNGPSNYRFPRHKHSSSVADVELEYNGYGGSSDTIVSSSGRRKVMNDERFMRQMPDEIIYTRPQPMYDELDGQHVCGNRNFSTMHRKTYSRIRSKSPVGSRTRSPSPWSSRRRRSPDEMSDQRRSPGLYRMRRTRSPDRSCFRDETVVRRRGSSPPYINRHHNEFRDMESGREHVYPRPNRRSPPARGFPRSARRSDGIDSRERDEAGIDERRKSIEGRGPFRPFRQGYNGENENMRFYVNDAPSPRPFRYCPDANAEFFEKNNMREREFNGRINHQSLAVPKRIRSMEEQQDGNYGSGNRVWHDDGFSDMPRGKRRRF